MITSGSTPIGTNGSTPVQVMQSGGKGGPFRSIRIINEGPNPGFYSIDGGANWPRLPAGVTYVEDPITPTDLIDVRIMVYPGMADISGVFARAI